MRDVIRSVLEATWLTPEGRFDISTLGPAIARADRTWRAGKNKRWIRDGSFTNLYLRLIVEKVPYPRPTSGSRKSMRDILGSARVVQLEDEFVKYTDSLPHLFDIDFPL